MLVTDATWAEFHPVRKALVQPLQAWRCVGWTDETLNFLMVVSRARRDHAGLPDGWLVGSPEMLLEAAEQLEPGTYRVYALDRAGASEGAVLHEVTGIYRERAVEHDEAYALWYSTSRGEMKPCSRFPREQGFPPELVRRLTFEADHNKAPGR